MASSVPASTCIRSWLGDTAAAEWVSASTPPLTQFVGQAGELRASPLPRVCRWAGYCRPNGTRGWPYPN